jgi:hypothetical protein
MPEYRDAIVRTIHKFDRSILTIGVIDQEIMPIRAAPRHLTEPKAAVTARLVQR